MTQLMKLMKPNVVDEADEDEAEGADVTHVVEAAVVDEADTAEKSLNC